MEIEKKSTGRHRVVIVGSGFGGLFAATKFKDEDVDVVLVSSTTHHLFQPLLYQVATGILSEGVIAPSTREVLKKQKNVEIFIGTVTDIDVDAKRVTAELLDSTQVYDYDSLIVAAGAGQSYFGNDHFAQFAPGMKSIDDALELRGRIFGAFETAELAAAAGQWDDVRALLTFVVVGAGPTGVEMAGQISELANRTLADDFRHINPKDARVVLVDAAPQVLPPFGANLGKKAQGQLESMGVEVLLGQMVTNVDATGIEMKTEDGTVTRIDSVCKVWAAGVAASPLGKLLGEKTGAEVDRSGRIAVQPDLSLPGHPEVYVVGDMMSLNKLPGVAQVAIQGGRYAATSILARVKGQPSPGPFKYFDKGSMATISRFSAVTKVGRLETEGFIAWLMWLGVHLFYIIGFKSRLTTMISWALAFLGDNRDERTATEQQVHARLAIDELGDKYRPSVEVPGLLAGSKTNHAIEAKDEPAQIETPKN